MIMMGEKRKAISAILGPEPEKEQEQDLPEVGHAIAQEMIDAFHSKDAQALWEAFKAGCQHCEQDESPESIEG